MSNLKIKSYSTSYCVEKENHPSFIDIYHCDFSPLSKKDASELAEMCKNWVELNVENKYTIQPSPNTCTVSVKNWKSLTVFTVYYHPDDTWKYGVDSKEKAIELCEKFIELKEKEITNRVETIKVKKKCYPDLYEVVDNGKTIGTFKKRIDAFMFASTIKPLDLTKGCPSLSKRWKESIRGIDSISEDIFNELSAYIFNNW